MADWRDWDSYYPPSRPRAAKGGIRAHSQHGGFAQNWWARRWLATLEGFNLGSRLQRGRSYARSGQVLSIVIEPGIVTAGVLGSRPKPYQVSIEVKPISATGWRKLAAIVSSQAIFGAKLLGGEMPEDIESAFKDAGLSLFPERYNDLHTDCSCPDSSNPCKHIAAVYYLLGEEFDRDPFLAFQLRGMSRDEFLRLLVESAPASAQPQEKAPPPVPLPVSPADFWKVTPLPEHLITEVVQPSTSAAILRRLGKFPFWRGRENLRETLEPIYAAAAARAAQAITPN
jgi:uncharacterized Zn finger protein